MRDLLNEINLNALDALPKGKIFDDAKRIDGIFKKSKYGWSEVIETFENNKDSAKIKYINIDDIEITQPNIQTNKIIKIIKNLDNVPLINVVEFKDGKKVIFDGHHRLISFWVLSKTKIKVNLVKEED